MTHKFLLTAIAAPVLSISLVTSATAQDSSSPAEMTALFACQTETDDAVRLRCFDDAVANLRAANASGDLLALSRDEVETVERDAFGFNLPSLPKLRGIFGSSDKTAKTDSGDEAKEPERLDRVTLPVDRWEKSKRGRYTFYLENGQIWKQIDSENLGRLRKGKDGRVTVEIRKASFGSYLLQINGKGRSIRVRRAE